jgi:hypothetical protein
MPVMEWPALARKLVTEREQMRVLLMSAHPCSNLPFLRKPFTMADLLEQAAAAMKVARCVPWTSYRTRRRSLKRFRR